MQLDWSVTVPHRDLMLILSSLSLASIVIGLYPKPCMKMYSCATTSNMAYALLSCMPTRKVQPVVRERAAFGLRVERGVVSRGAVQAHVRAAERVRGLPLAARRRARAGLPRTGRQTPTSRTRGSAPTSSRAPSSCSTRGTPCRYQRRSPSRTKRSHTPCVHAHSAWHASGEVMVSSNTSSPLNQPGKLNEALLTAMATTGA